MEEIYGRCTPFLPKVAADLRQRMEDIGARLQKERGAAAYEHLLVRIKSEASMKEKCDRRNLPRTPESALRQLYDAVAIRLVTSYIDDIWALVEEIRKMPGCRVIQEKDYVRHAKSNGYRSYHMILELEEPFEDVDGNVPGHYFAEVQLRTIAMDSWAALEHELKYKRDLKGFDLIVGELKRVADELASCDISMQTIRDLIRLGTGGKNHETVAG